MLSMSKGYVRYIGKIQINNLEGFHFRKEIESLEMSFYYHTVKKSFNYSKFVELNVIESCYFEHENTNKNALKIV